MRLDFLSSYISTLKLHFHAHVSISVTFQKSVMYWAFLLRSPFPFHVFDRSWVHLILSIWVVNGPLKGFTTWSICLSSGNWRPMEKLPLGVPFHVDRWDFEIESTVNTYYDLILMETEMETEPWAWKDGLLFWDSETKTHNMQRPPKMQKISSSRIRLCIHRCLQHLEIKEVTKPPFTTWSYLLN